MGFHYHLTCVHVCTLQGGREQPMAWARLQHTCAQICAVGLLSQGSQKCLISVLQPIGPSYGATEWRQDIPSNLGGLSLWPSMVWAWSKSNAGKEKPYLAGDGGLPARHTSAQKTRKPFALAGREHFAANGWRKDLVSWVLGTKEKTTLQTAPFGNLWATS